MKICVALDWNRFQYRAVSSPVTIQSVAARAGVAVSTVSRVLNGGQSSPKARARVTEAVQTLGYRPSATARNLKLGRTGIVGLVGASSQAPWFIQLLGGMELGLRQHGASVAIASLEVDGVFDPSAVENWIAQRSVDAIAFIRPGKREKFLAAEAEHAGIATAFVLPDLQFDHGIVIEADNVQAGFLAGNHLVGLGHRRLTFIGGPRESIDTQRRLEGLQNCLRLVDSVIPPERISYLHSYELVAGIDAAELWLANAKQRQATAVVLGNDAIALGFMRRLQQEGMRIPHELSVLGFDGIPAGEFAWPSLTSVTQPTHQMGAETARQLLHARDPVSPAPLQLHYQLQLVARESTQPPRSQP